MYLIEDLHKQHAALLSLELVTGESGLKRRIRVPEVHRPGLSLAGYLKNHAHNRILVFGKVELEYLRDLTKEERIERLQALLSNELPAVIVARRYRPPKELVTLCEKNQIPLFRANMSTMNLMSKLTIILTAVFGKSMSCHGTLVEVYGVGVLIKGNSSIGKSETALGLIERGHRLVSDDAVKVSRHENSLEGKGAEITRHLMEIRGIGIINVAYLYGAVCVRDSKSIDIVVELELWDDNHFYDRLGLEEKYTDILGVKVPYHILPVKPGRDVVLLIETIALNHRLKGMGYHSAKELSARLLEITTSKAKRKGVFDEIDQQSKS